VLHALAAPGFQSANPPAKLAEVFANLRSQRIDMSPVVLFLPKLLAPPSITEDGMLRLAGAYDTQPKQVHFDLVFERISGQWRLFGISLGTVDAPPPTAGVATPAGSGSTAGKETPGKAGATKGK